MVSSQISRHLVQIGKVKKIDKWVPYNLNGKHTKKADAYRDHHVSQVTVQKN